MISYIESRYSSWELLGKQVKILCGAAAVIDLINSGQMPATDKVGKVELRGKTRVVSQKTDLLLIQKDNNEPLFSLRAKEMCKRLQIQYL